MRAGAATMFGVAACVPAVLLAGCQQPATPIAAQPDPVGVDAYPTVTVEPAVLPYLAVDYESVIVEPADGLVPMAVQVPARSTANSQYLVQYTFSWYDDAGALIGDSGWRLLAMEPGMRRVLRGSASDLAASRWTVEIRSAR